MMHYVYETETISNSTDAKNQLVLTSAKMIWSGANTAGPRVTRILGPGNLSLSEICASRGPAVSK